jgi:tRNA modification GTPase
MGGIGIIRVSGPEALPLLQQLFVPHKPRSHFTSHKLYYGTVIARDGQVLDEALAVYMRAPHTYTREDIVELHCHGSYLVLQEILRNIFELGARSAENGEFTKRAFLAGRIDLTQAEAVLDLLQAQTEKSARLATNQLQGALFHILENIRQELITILALLEVAIDFPDDDVEIFNGRHIDRQVQATIITPLQRLIALSEQGKIVREGVKVVIAGQPNVGKSSLLNALLQEERALVNALPGTTRDTIEEQIAIRGIPVHLVDTAGIRTHEDPVEAMGIERARQKLEEADLILFLVDAQAGMGTRDRELYHTVRDKKHLIVINKRDLVAPEHLRRVCEEFPERKAIAISARDHQGLDTLQDAIYQAVIADGGEIGEQMTCAPNTRHRSVLNKTLLACQQFEQAMLAGAPVDLLAVEIQLALDYLGDITGLTTTDDVLDAVFSQFCIGK